MKFVPGVPAASDSDQIENLFETQVRQLTFEYTCQLTAFYGAQCAYGAAKLNAKESLVIHVVGARQAEFLDITRWEIFLHQLPQLESLTVAG